MDCGGSCASAGLARVIVVNAPSMMPRRFSRFAVSWRLNLFDGAATVYPVAEAAQIVDIGIAIF